MADFYEENFLKIMTDVNIIEEENSIHMETIEKRIHCMVPDF